VNIHAEDLKRRTKRFALDGANYRAACRARSRADFIAKIALVEEEADESGFWLELTRDSGLASSSAVGPLLREADELTAIFGRSTMTAAISRSAMNHSLQSPITNHQSPIRVHRMRTRDCSRMNCWT
jgi:hypothetical protein